MTDESRNDPDAALMLRTANGDRAAFEELVVKYRKSVLNTAYRYTGNPSAAEELAQEVFVRVYKSAKTYTPEARFSTWLFTIVRNICINYYTREGRHEQHMDPDQQPDTIDKKQENPETEAIRKERERKVREAVAALPVSLRFPLILHQFQGLSHDEVAKILDISLAAVKIRIYRARQMLMDQLREYVDM